MHGEFLKPVRPATAFSACARKHRWRRAPGTSDTKFALIKRDYDQGRAVERCW